MTSARERLAALFNPSPKPPRTRKPYVSRAKSPKRKPITEYQLKHLMECMVGEEEIVLGTSTVRLMIAEIREARRRNR